jgi:ABC-2 type transport system permease protein
MSWQVVARKDFEDAVRSRWLVGLATLYALLVAAAVGIGAWLFGGGGTTVSSTQLVNSPLIKDGIVTTFVPLVSLVVAYNAVVGERESGSLKLLLALPHSRSDVVLGKVVGRGAAVAVAIVAGFALPIVVFVVDGSFAFEAVGYVQYVLLTALLGVAFVSVAVGVSAATASNRIAIAAAITIYLVFVVLFGAIHGSIGLVTLFSGWPEWMPLTVQETQRAVQLLSPTGSFKIIVNRALGGSLFGGAEARLQLSAFAMLLTWTVVPPLLGLIRFQDADL